MTSEQPLQLYLELARVFHDHGHDLYVVGGTSRDYLLKKPFTDYDLATSATPEEMVDFLPDANYQFAKFGTVSLKQNNKKIEITTLREEGKYTDFRHPAYIRFVKNPSLDYKRRDLTINALYINKELKVLDFCEGLNDLGKGVIRMIGNPVDRFHEDPLRIIRVLRFSAKLNFEIDPLLKDAITKSRHLLTYLNHQKVKEEIRKVDIESIDQFKELIKKYKIEL